MFNIDDELIKVKRHLRIDDDFEDEDIRELIQVADEYLINAGCKGRGTVLFSRALRMLCAHWYENREVIGKSNKLTFGLDAIICQLRLVGDEV